MDVQIKHLIVVYTIGKKFLIVLLEMGTLLQSLRDFIGGYNEDEKKHKL